MLNSEITRKIKEILEKNGVELAYVFGSYARGKEGPLSDFDVGIVFPKGISSNKYFDLETKIS